MLFILHEVRTIVSLHGKTRLIFLNQ